MVKVRKHLTDICPNEIQFGTRVTPSTSNAHNQNHPWQAELSKTQSLVRLILLCLYCFGIHFVGESLSCIADPKLINGF